jgi:hypothetical protein
LLTRRLGTWWENTDMVYEIHMKNEQFKTIKIGGKRYPRITFGGELRVLKSADYEYFSKCFGDDELEMPSPCHDCDVKLGEIHLIGCDVEICPACKRQLISCECEHRYHVWDSESFQKSVPEVKELYDNHSKRLLTLHRIAGGSSEK